MEYASSCEFQLEETSVSIGPLRRPSTCSCSSSGVPSRPVKAKNIFATHKTTAALLCVSKLSKMFMMSKISSSLSGSYLYRMFSTLTWPHSEN